jgi:hypothetical protein
MTYVRGKWKMEHKK